jgi:CubicO group peptidase (beta-lactamase class C family)
MYLIPSMKVATGYATKYVCSATFISGLDEKVIDSDLDFSLVKKVNYTVNHEEKYVEGTLFGMAKQRAWFKKTAKGCGCVVTDEKPDYDQSIMDIPRQTYHIADSLFWPVGDKLNDTVLEGVNYAKLKRVVAETLDSNKATRAITITYRNFLLAEAYAPGVDRNTRLLGWSMTKTMSNALIGNLVKNGMVDIDKPAGIEEWKNDDRKNITISNLLQMSSGLDWEEDYGKLSNVTRMLYLTPDMVSYSLQPQLRSTPDSEWVYSSGTSNILSGIIRSKFDSENEYLNFPYDSLFAVLGMKSAVLETDRANNYVFSSYCWATARDWTRFGLLYLNEGNWFGKQVFTQEWTRYSTTPATSSEGQYGAQIWLNAGRKEMPSAPPGAYYEDGFGGQRVLMIPSKDLAVVMLSGQQKNFDFNQFLARVLDCFEN